MYIRVCVCVIQEHLWVAAFSLSTMVGTIQNLIENAFKIKRLQTGCRIAIQIWNSKAN